jgi:hypothetical protein
MCFINHCCHRKSTSITYSKHVFVALVTQKAKGMYHSKLSPVACLTVHIFPHYWVNGMIFRHHLWNIKCVLFLYNFVWNIPHSKNSAWYCHKCTKVFLSDFNKNWIFLICKKIHQISWKSIQYEPRCSMQWRDRQTDRQTW